MTEKIRRREFFSRSAKYGLSLAAGRSLFSLLPRRPLAATAGPAPDIAVVKGDDVFGITVKAVEALGGMSRFVPQGARVALLPNVQSRHPGTFTKPEVLRAVIRMCKSAGAAEVNCLSWLTMKHWEDTGLARIVEEEGAGLKLVENEEAHFERITVAKGKALPEAQVMKELADHSVFLNLPVTKDHAGNKFTGTMKNLMGLNFRTNNRGFHKENWQTDAGAVEYLDQCIADLNTVIAPTLNIVDATEFIITNGPMGPGELLRPQKVIAGTDRVAVDSYCTTLWGLKAEEIIMIQRGYEHGLGEINLGNVNVVELTV